MTLEIQFPSCYLHSQSDYILQGWQARHHKNETMQHTTSLKCCPVHHVACSSMICSVSEHIKVLLWYTTAAQTGSDACAREHVLYIRF
jgi:hypothetical protein